MKDSVSGVLVRKVGKEELAGEKVRGRTLDLDVDMRRTPWVATGPDGLETKRARAVGELMAAITKARVVVAAILVTVPDVDYGTRDGATVRGKH